MPYSESVSSRIDLIALDLDGTLLDRDGVISRANRKAIEDALRAGTRVVLVTGRGTDLPARLVRELRLNIPAICAHGALTKDFLSGRTLGHVPVPLVHAVPMIAYAQSHQLDVAVYFQETFYRLHGGHIYMDDMLGQHWREVGSLLDVLHEAPTFVRFLGRASVQAARQAFWDRPLHFKYEAWEGFEECAITSLEATKHHALQRLCADFGIPSARVLAVGDSPNDVPMLRWAGIGVAMGNAPATVREAIGRVTASCDRDGVAQAIEQYVLAA